MSFACRGVSEQVQTVPIDAPKIAAAQGDAVPIEKFENLNRDLAAVVELVAQLSGRELPTLPRIRELAHDLDHFSDRVAQEEMVLCDLVHSSHPRSQLEQLPDRRLGSAERTGNVAHGTRCPTSP